MKQRCYFLSKPNGTYANDLFSGANGPDNCCFVFYPRRINKNLIRSYNLTDPRCPKAAVILALKNSRQICADPSLSWVKNIMKIVDKNSF
ncbi:C-C motif chemokine 13-like [Archocentrus centrarchus]|uniref:C-C motif chemokine 13-like n=1 Tax=Archocentrus centrarchus TaxID=63155 RepID=UPI0011E9D60D|nr:C-C motif chemokine 13-like [Archocentrus centrarchus]